MRRADRLFQILQALRPGPTTAAALAGRLEVSERTIYRDVRDLIDSGVPIEGEAGLGYVLAETFHLPPLMFSAEEVEALTLGARVVESWADPALVRAARSVLEKVDAVLPEPMRGQGERSRLFSVQFEPSAAVAERLGSLREAIRDRHKVVLHYRRPDGVESERVVQPLCLVLMMSSWMLAAWCELRADFRSFRLDRVDRMTVLDEAFEEQPDQGLEAFLRKVHAEGEENP